MYQNSQIHNSFILQHKRVYAFVSLVIQTHIYLDVPVTVSINGTEMLFLKS